MSRLPALPWSISPRMFRWVCLCAICSASVLWAEDRVVLRTASGSRIGMPCVIVDYTGRELTYLARSGSATKRTPRSEIVEVTTHYLDPHTEARKLFAQGEASAAFVRLETALEQENRKWVRREILALQVKCALWNGDRTTAGERFLAIFDSDPDTFHFHLLPLAWSENAPDEELVRAARVWLAQRTSPAALLLGASHLLTDPKQSGAALKVLKELARDAHLEIQRLTQMQLWRAKALTEEVSRDELFRWERTIEDLGHDLGGGPHYVLGLGWRGRQDELAAAAAWLWLPAVAAEDRWLAAQAAWQAGQALERAGQTREARSLYEEIVRRFAQTPVEDRAQSALQRLKE